MWLKKLLMYCHWYNFCFCFFDIWQLWGLCCFWKTPKSTLSSKASAFFRRLSDVFYNITIILQKFYHNNAKLLFYFKTFKFESSWYASGVSQTSLECINRPATDFNKDMTTMCIHKNIYKAKRHARFRPLIIV